MATTRPTRSKATAKDELIDQYQSLLDEHGTKVRELEAAKKKLTELEKKVQAEALDTAEQATVSSVISSLGKLRGQIGATLNDINDQMTSLAAELESYRRAAATQKARIEELYKIEVVADTLSKLVGSYEERRAEEESSFSERMAQMEAELESRRTTQEKDLAEKKESLERAIAEQRTAWTVERDREKSATQEEKANKEKTRAREEAEYLYTRDRERKLEQDSYDENKKLAERELAEKMHAAEQSFTAREAALKERETRAGDLEKQVADLQARLSRECEAAAKSARQQAETAATQAAKLVDVERQWEKKVFEQRITHLEKSLEDKDKANIGLSAELSNAQAQVNDVAKRAIEGAALNKAYESVNRIALEQARSPEQQKRAERDPRS
ncbi:MAG: hypothetical protein MUC50_17765 [Myxococcota bacterium]|jgi:hypothetical protein|nr:hypothetical protein [Myxococcota bacterium]